MAPELPSRRSHGGASAAGGRRHRRALTLGLASLVTGAGAMALSDARPPSAGDWPAFALWALSVGMALAVTAGRESRGDAGGEHRRPTGSDVGAALAIAAVAGALLLPYLSEYPMEVAGDPPRDSGLLTQWIATGESKEIFGYGSNHGFGKVVSLTGVPFYFVFGPSSLTFKALAAAIGIATSITFFFLVRRYLSLAHAMGAAMLLLALPVFLFHARREPVVAYSSLGMIAVYAAVLRVLEHEAKPRAFALLGLVAGLTVHFHGAVKAAGFAALVLCAGVSIWRTIRRRQSARQLLAVGGAAVLGFLVGLGPLAVHTDLAVLLSKGRIAGAGGHFEPAVLLDAYQRSLRVFFDLPTRSSFPHYQPLIPSPVLSAFFALGAVLGFTVAPLHLCLVALFFLLVLPFTNSAVTDLVNGDYRLAPLLPVVALVISLGIAVVWKGLQRIAAVPARPALRAALILFVGVAAGSQVYRFFAEEQGRHRENLAAHLLYFALEDIEQVPALRDAPELCVSGNAWLREQMQYEHMRFGWEYYLPRQAVRVSELAGTERNELFLSTSCPGTRSSVEWLVRVHCDPRRAFVCPGEENGVDDVRILIDPRPAAPGAEAPREVSSSEP